jgi:amino acid permease
MESSAGKRNGGDDKIFTSDDVTSNPSDAEHGDIQPAGQFYSSLGAAAREQAGLKRSLTGRHTALIAIASGIGTGLFVSTYLIIASFM